MPIYSTVKTVLYNIEFSLCLFFFRRRVNQILNKMKFVKFLQNFCIRSVYTINEIEIYFSYYKTDIGHTLQTTT